MAVKMKTRLALYMDNGKKLDFVGDNNANCAGVGSGGEPIKMTARIRGGKHSAIQRTKLIFKNTYRSCQIRGPG